MDQDQILTLVLALLAATGPHLYNWFRLRGQNKVDDAAARKTKAEADSLVIDNLIEEIDRLKQENRETREKLAALGEIRDVLENERRDKARIISENLTLRAELSATQSEVARLRVEVADERRRGDALQERVRQLEKKSTGPIGGAQAAPAP